MGRLKKIFTTKLKHLIELKIIKTVVEFCKTVVAAAAFLMPILVIFVSVSLLCSVTDTCGTNIGIKNGAAAATVLQNSTTVLS